MLCSAYIPACKKLYRAWDVLPLRQPILGAGLGKHGRAPSFHPAEELQNTLTWGTSLLLRYLNIVSPHVRVPHGAKLHWIVAVCLRLLQPAPLQLCRTEGVMSSASFWEVRKAPIKPVFLPPNPETTRQKIIFFETDRTNVSATRVLGLGMLWTVRL